MLVLGRVAALDVAQGRIGLDDARVAQTLEAHEVLGLADAIEPAATEGQRAEVLVDGGEKTLGARHAQWHVADVEVLHVVRALHVVVHDAFARTAERLYRVQLSLLRTHIPHTHTHSVN